LTCKLVQNIETEKVSKPPTKEEIEKFLKAIQKNYYEERVKGATHEEAISANKNAVFSMGIGALKVTALTNKSVHGLVSSANGGNGMLSAAGLGHALPWVVGGVMYTAQMGINYRKFK